MTIGRTTGAARKDKMKSRRWAYSFNAQVSFAESRFASLTNQDTNLIESDELYICRQEVEVWGSRGRSSFRPSIRQRDFKSNCLQRGIKHINAQKRSPDPSA